MHSRPVPQSQQPPGYVPGAGRGAVGFQTTADVGPARAFRAVKNYTPKPKKPPQVTFSDPTTGLTIHGDINEHMRVQLLNPQWRQQQQTEKMKNPHTNYASGGETVQTLGILAQNIDDDRWYTAQQRDPTEAMSLAEQVARIRESSQRQRLAASSAASQHQQLVAGSSGWLLGAHEGDFYFWDSATHASIWAARGCADLQQFVGQPWIHGIDPSNGRSYFYHEASQQSVWGVSM